MRGNTAGRELHPALKTLLAYQKNAVTAMISAQKAYNKAKKQLFLVVSECRQTCF